MWTCACASVSTAQLRGLSPLLAFSLVGPTITAARVHSNRALKKLQGRPKFLRKFDTAGADVVPVPPLK
jgi:hypothetical protein